MKALFDIRAKLYSDFAQKMSNQAPLWLAAIENETSFGGVGGTYVLMDHDKEVRRLRPVSNLYLYWKVTSHLLLEMTLLSLPYLNTEKPHDDIQQKVSTIKTLIDQSLKLIMHDESLSRSSKTRNHLISIFNLTNNYINKCIETNKVSKENYQDFQNKLIPLIRDNVSHASSIQVQQTMGALNELKKEYADDWDNIHALVTTIWPVTEDSPREQILRTLIDNPDNLHVIQYTPTIEELKAQLGRKLLDKYLQTPRGDSDTKSPTRSVDSEAAGGKCPIIDYRSKAVKEAIDEDDTSIFITGQRIPIIRLDTKEPTNFYESMVSLNNQIRSDYSQTIAQVSQNIPILYIDEEAFFKAPYKLRVVLFRPGKENINFEPPEGSNLLIASLAILDIIRMLSSPNASQPFDSDSLQKIIDMSIELKREIEQCKTLDQAAKDNVILFLAEVIGRLPSGGKSLNIDFTELHNALAEQMKLVNADMIRLYKNYFLKVFDETNEPNFYTFISVHSNTQMSVSELAIRELMDPKKAITHVLSAENIKSDEDAKKTVARITFDTAAAKLAFQQVQNFQVALSTPIDLMADDIRKAISSELASKEEATKPRGKCPFEHKFFDKKQQDPLNTDEQPGNKPKSS